MFKIRITEVIEKMGIDEWILRGEPTNEEEFNQMFRKIIGSDANGRGIESTEHDITWTDIEAKIAELEAAEPLRLLRIERDNLLTQTDWEVQRNTEKGIDNTELITYRNALRDLPQEIEQGNVEPPTLDEQGNLVFDNWPTRGETI